jgi:hypothetical protein
MNGTTNPNFKNDEHFQKAADLALSSNEPAMIYIKIVGIVVQYVDEMIRIRFADGTEIKRWMGYDLHAEAYPDGVPDEGYPTGTKVWFNIGQ